MDFHKYIETKKEFDSLLLKFIENDNNYDDDYQNLLLFLESYEYRGNQEELEHILRLILNISNNHYRHPSFFSKIEKILLYFANDIKQTFSNSEIFNFFESSKPIILFFIKNKIIKYDEPIHQIIKQKFYQNGPEYCHFFLPEIESYIFSNDERKKEDESWFNSNIKNEEILNDSEILANFEEKRSKGENDSYICSLIQSDSIVDFISHVNHNHISLSTHIKPSIFETNQFLIDKKEELTLIEYSAFFGSIQIFRYLQMNNVEMNPSLWLYVIHSKNAELIHFLEENHIKPDDLSYEKCYLEAIKCHHNDIAEYIENNLLVVQNAAEIEDDPKSSENVVVCTFRYCNYLFFPKKFDISYIFYYLGYFNYDTLVDILLKISMKNIMKVIIYKKNYFFNEKIHQIFFC